MRPRGSRLFTVVSLLSGAATAALCAGFMAQRPEALTGSWAQALLLGVFAFVSYLLSFSASSRDRMSLELAFFIAAVMVLPFPAPVLVAGAAALLGSLVRGKSSLTAGQTLAVGSANLTIAAAMTAAACWVASVAEAPLRSLGGGSDLSVAAGAGAGGVPTAAAPLASGAPLLGDLALSGLLFLVMGAVDLVFMTLWMLLRRQSPGPFVRRFFGRILPFELVNVPFACLLALALRTAAGTTGYLMLATVGVVLSFALRRLSDAEDALTASSAELGDRSAQISALNAIGRSVASNQDAARIFETVRDECRLVFRADVVSVASLDPDSLEVKIETSANGDVPWKTETIGRSVGPTAVVLDTGSPLLLADAPAELASRGIEPVGLDPEIRSIAAVPLMVDTRAVGVLMVQSFEPDAYDQKHLALLGTVGQQLAGAIENARHYRLANIDHLTGLFQRDFFYQRLGDEHRRAARYETAFSLMMLDIDGLKELNDRYGRTLLDRFLQQAGRRIKGLLRAPDLPCRYGGGKFCVLLPETDAAGARVLAEKIRTDIASLRISEGEQQVGATVSVGISCFPAHFEGSVPGLIQKAERALTAAKTEGRNRVSLAAA